MKVLMPVQLGRCQQRITGRIMLVLVLLALTNVGRINDAEAAPTDVTIAVRSIANPLYVKTPSEFVWGSRGGLLAARPAVAVSDQFIHYMGIGINGILYHRTETTGWTRLAPDGFRCQAVGAIARSGQVYVGCTGLNGALYELNFPGSSQTPFVGDYRRLGGNIVGPAAGYNTDGGVAWMVKGGSYFGDKDGAQQEYNVYVHSPLTSWQRFYTYCAAPPGAAMTPEGFFMACQFGPADVLVESWNAATDTWNAFTLPAVTVGAPAMVGSVLGADLFVVGRNGGVYGSTLTWGSPNTGWHPFGGVAVGGVAAAARDRAGVLPALVIGPPNGRGETGG